MILPVRHVNFHLSPRHETPVGVSVPLTHGLKAAEPQTRESTHPERGRFKLQVQIHTLIDLLIQYLPQHLPVCLTIKNNTETKILRGRKGRRVKGKESSVNTEGQDSYYAGSSIVNNIRSASTPFPLNCRSAQNQRKGRPSHRNNCSNPVTAGQRTPAACCLLPEGLCHPRQVEGLGQTSGGGGTEGASRFLCLKLCCYFFFLRSTHTAGEP